MKTRIRGLALLLALLAAVSACSSHAAQRSVGMSTELRSADQLLTNDVTSLRQTRHLLRAEQILDQECMQRLGLRYPIAGPGRAPGLGTATADAVGTGRHATYGVGWTGRSGPSARDRYVNSLQPAQRTRYLNALEGSADHTARVRLPSGMILTYLTGGCMGAGRTELYGSVTAAIEEQAVAQDVRLIINAALAKDQAHLAVLHAWQRCMAVSGWTVTSPEAAIQAVEFQSTQPADAKHFDSKQTAMATADVTCDVRTGLRAKAAQQRDTYLRDQPADVLTMLRTIYLNREAAYHRALRILAPTDD